MPRRLNHVCALLALVLLLPAAFLAADQPAETAARKIKDFQLRDVWQARLAGRVRRSQSRGGRVPGTVCPLVKLYIPRLNDLHARLAKQGVALVAIDSNVQDTLTETAAFVRRHDVAFPVLMDPDGAVAQSFGAARTPQAFVLDAQHVVRYAGRIDDQFGVGYQRPATYA